MSAREVPPGLGGRLRPGEMPALVVVDLSLGFTDPESPLACDVRTALPAAVNLLDAARAANVPVAFSTIAFRSDLSDGGPWLRKVPAMHVLVEESRWVKIDPRLPNAPGDLLLTKQGASAFHRTELASWLRSIDVDTVIVVGASTSGVCPRHGRRCHAGGLADLRRVRVRRRPGPRRPRGRPLRPAGQVRRRTALREVLAHFADLPRRVR